MLDEILDKCPDAFNIKDMMGRVEDRTPYIIVAFQECERMNILMSEIKRSLKELNLGLKVDFLSTCFLFNFFHLFTQLFVIVSPIHRKFAS